MSPLQVGGIVAALVGAAVWTTYRAVERAPRSLAGARAQMYGPASVDLQARAVGAARPGRRRDGAAVRWTERHFAGRLELVGMTAADVVARAVMAAGVMVFAVFSAVAALMTVGLLPASPVWFVLPFVLAGLAAWITVRDVGAKCDARHKELRQAANDFVQLVAVGLTTDQSVEEAIRFALGVGASDAFESLRTEVATAPQRGVPVWEAIDDFGRRSDVRELCEFANSLERQGVQGVSISQTVGTLATAMRAKALDELEREADRANANLSGPTVGFVVTTVVFLAYPLAQRISDAFGG